MYGDVFRRTTGNTDYRDEGRLRHLTNAANAAKEYESKGWIVLMSFIMPRKRYRDKMRKLLEVSRIVYLPGGTLWEGTTYQRPTEREMETRYNHTFTK